jgi:FKBP-type peptidyl-prolyl cis-trans isomerase 2
MKEENAYDYQQSQQPVDSNKINVNYKMIIAFVVIIIVVVIAVYFLLSRSTASAVNTGSVSADAVKAGDTVKVMYVGYFQNGTVFDTNYESVAQKNGIERTSFEPLEFSVGQGEVIDGFDNAVSGMKVGEKKTFTLQPADAYGEYDETLIERIPKVGYTNRTTEIETVFDVPKYLFAQVFGKEPSVNDIVNSSTESISYKVLNTTTANVTLEMQLTKGQIISSQSSLWNSTVIDISGKKAKIRQDPQNGTIMPNSIGYSVITIEGDKIVSTLNAEVGTQFQTQFGFGMVKEVTENEVIIDTNPPLAGKTLVFDVELVSID